MTTKRAEQAVMYLVRGSEQDAADPTAGPDLAAPSAALFLTEPLRWLVDLSGLPLAMPWLLAAPRGDGHGVLVLPGLLATDTSTVPLRPFLSWLGYDVRGWDLGRNQGPTEAVLAVLPKLLLTHAEQTGGPVSLIGWSLGGIYARELARQHPSQVRQVITLGSPFALRDSRQSRVHGPYQRRSHLHADAARLPSHEQRAGPLGVPSTAVYSRWDGIVSWRACVAPETELHQNIEVRCSHLGFGVDLATLWVIADRLAAPPGQRVRFRPPWLLWALYP